MPPDIRQLLFDRLQQQGVNNDEAPALLRDLSKILESNPGIDPVAASLKLHMLGWNGVTLGLSVNATGAGVNGIGKSWLVPEHLTSRPTRPNF